MRLQTKSFIILLLFSIVAFAFLAPHYYYKFSTQSQQIRSAINLKTLALSINVFTGDHDNKLPTKLSILIPDYCYNDEVFYLFPRVFKPYNFGNIEENFYPHSEEAGIEFVDTLSPYRLLHLPTAHWAVLHETPGIWQDGSISWIFLEKNESGAWGGISVIRGSTQEFEAALQSKLEKRTTSNKSDKK